MKRHIAAVLVAWSITLLIPLLVSAGVDDDLKKNLGKSRCIKSWHYNKSVFKIYFDPNQCKQKEPTATLLTVRYIFESNKAKFPKQIEIDYGNGPVDSYPFSNIPSLNK